jgi:hypothetical protein
VPRAEVARGIQTLIKTAHQALRVLKLEYTTRDSACNRCLMLLTLKTLCAVFAVVAIVYVFVTGAWRSPPDKSVKLSNDEFSTLVGVANYALKKLGRPTLSCRAWLDTYRATCSIQFQIYFPGISPAPNWLFWPPTLTTGSPDRRLGKIFRLSIQTSAQINCVR